jgi:drug/metabolite transporter (DMT)-like permease
MLAICSGVALASTQDALLKWVSGSYPVHEALIIRSLVATPIVLFLALRAIPSPALFDQHTPRSLLRGLILCSAYLAFVLSIASMPIADTVAIYFTMPFFVAGLAFPVLGERVQIHRWLAIAAGFVGVIIMLDPSSDVFEPAAFLALYSAFGYALGQMMGRDIARYVPPTVMAVHQNIAYLAVATLLVVVSYSFDFSGVTHKSLSFLLRHWSMPPWHDLLLMCALGVCASLAMVMFGTAYKLAESSFVAPFEYSAMIWAVLYGFLLFGDIPGLNTISGGLVVVAAGLFMLWMDRRRDQRAGEAA